MNEMEAMSPAADESTGAAVALSQSDGACLHCLSRSGLPPTFAITREPEQKRRDLNISTPLVKAFVPFVISFAPTLLVRPNAPPGAAARRHLLLSTFVI